MEVNYDIPARYLRAYSGFRPSEFNIEEAALFRHSHCQIELVSNLAIVS